MKKDFFILTLLMASMMFSCVEPAYINGPGDNSHNLDTIPITIPDTNGIVISVDSAIAICKSLPADAVTGELYKISGIITKNTTNPMNVPGSYTNINFNICLASIVGDIEIDIGV
jgi:hypothetical protein